MIKTGIISSAYFEIDDFEAGMSLMKSHGYDCIDYQELGNFAHSPLYKMTEEELKSYLCTLRDCAKKNGLEFHQLHGIWPHVDDTTEEGRQQSIEYFKKNILCASYLDCPRVVVHPCMPGLFLGKKLDDEIQLNVRLLKQLAPYAREHSVTICLENMPFPHGSHLSYIENVKKVLDEVDDEYVKACLDTGHFEAVGTDIYSAIKLLGSHLSTLHVHDSAFGQDRHTIPFQALIDWDGFIRGLKEIGYNGVMSLETRIGAKTPQPMKEELERALAELARYFADTINAK